MHNDNSLISLVSELAKLGLARHYLSKKLIAEKVASVMVDPDMHEKLFRDFLESLRISSQDDLTQYCLDNFVSVDDLRAQALLSARIKQHTLSEYSQLANSHFLNSKSSYDSVLYSLIRVKDQGLALELYLRLISREATFDNIAKEYSSGPERFKNGLVGPSPLSKAHPDLANYLASAVQGKINEPIKIDQWWLVVRLESLQSASLDDQLLPVICYELFHKDIQAEVSSLLSRIRSSADV